MQDAGDEAALFASIRLSPIATVITNPRLPDNPIAAVNQAFERLTGYRAGEAVGRNCRFLGGPQTEAEATNHLRTAIAAARPTMVEVTNYRRDGSVFRNAVMIAPIFDEAGKLAYFIGSQMAVPEGSGSGARGQEARDRLAMLTPRQRQVLRHMALGLRNKQIAAELSINEKTVKMHRAALLERLGAATSADAVRLAVEAGL